jgi:repressor of nif and glnA expression
MSPGDAEDMGREDRKRQTLEVLVESGMAVPLKVLTRNVKLQGATFEESSVRRYLNELLDDGLVIKIDPFGLDDRKIIEVGKSEEGYWMASQKGRERIKSEE